MHAIRQIEGIGPIYAEKLHNIGIDYEEQLLVQGAGPRRRKKIAESAGISNKLILKWVNRADLARVDGIGEEYADLLEYSGVDTVIELATRNPENLYLKMNAVNQARKLVRRMPGQKQVAAWIAQAKQLPRMIRY